MRFRLRSSSLVLVTAALVLALASPARSQGRATAVAATSLSDLRGWDTTVTNMARSGELQLRRTDPDTLIAGRTHERFDQVYKGVAVYGGDMTRQIADGVTVSIFGTVYSDLALDVTPRLDVDAASAVIAGETGVTLGANKRPRLLILPVEGGYRLAYHASAFVHGHGTEYFIDAGTGEVIDRRDAVRHQTPVGRGTGVLGDAKKMSVSAVSGRFTADDPLRPPLLLTFDMKGNVARMDAILNGVIGPANSDIASDTDNDWGDGAIVDAHAYAGYVYDFYFKRFGRKGLDDRNLEIWSFVHPALRSDFFSQPDDVIDEFYLNAGYYGDGIMVYGEGLPLSLTSGGQRINYFSGGLDVVAHELTHGVTEFTSNLIYQNESGALNESFSDMMGTAAEFYFQTTGSGTLKADYLLGEDVATPGGFRSMANPAAYGDPDHYSRRYTGTADNGGVHVNSAIPNQVYYLAIEGGTNRTSGLSVQGVGQANRDQIEKVMYRAFTRLIPANATFAVARAATIQAARDLYGTSSAAERAVTQAWTAVGVN